MVCVSDPFPQLSCSLPADVCASATINGRHDPALVHVCAHMEEGLRPGAGSHSMFGISATDSIETHVAVTESRVCLDWGSVFYVQIIHNAKALYSNTDEIGMATMRKKRTHVSDFF